MTEYKTALKFSGYTKTLTYNKHRQTTRPKRTRQRNIIWYNPPISNNVQTNIGKTFLRLVSKHFPKHHKYHSLFNKNNIKVSYSCMENMGSIINKHNNKVLSNNNNHDNNESLFNSTTKAQIELVWTLDLLFGRSGLSFFPE